MAINAKLQKGSAPKNRVAQPNIEPASHAARLVQVIDLGLQAQRPYKGEEKPPVDMLYVTYELSHIFMVDEKGVEDPELPRWISEDFAFYSLDADKAKSTQRYMALDPKQAQEGDWSKLLGAPCSVLVVNNTKGDKVYDNVGSVGAPVKVPGYVQPELVNPPVFFDLSEPNLEVFNKLPEFLRERIKGNLNYNGSKLQALLGEASSAAPAPQESDDAAPEDNPY